MTQHQLPRRASLIVSAGFPQGAWHCVGCGEILAVRHIGNEPTGPAFAAVRSDLAEMAGHEVGIVTLGLPARTRLRRKDQRAGRSSPKPRSFRPDMPTWVGLRPLPLAVYCPRAGVCGVRQHLQDDANLIATNI